MEDKENEQNFNSHTSKQILVKVRSEEMLFIIIQSGSLLLAWLATLVHSLLLLCHVATAEKSSKGLSAVQAHHHNLVAHISFFLSFFLASLLTCLAAASINSIPQRILYKPKSWAHLTSFL